MTKLSNTVKLIPLDKPFYEFICPKYHFLRCILQFIQ